MMFPSENQRTLSSEKTQENVVHYLQRWCLQMRGQGFCLTCFVWTFSSAILLFMLFHSACYIFNLHSCSFLLVFQTRVSFLCKSLMAWLPLALSHLTNNIVLRFAVHLLINSNMFSVHRLTCASTH